MVLVCSKCDARLQVDDSRIPASPLAVRCPKCQAEINVDFSGPEPAPSEVAASAPVGFERPAAAQLFKPHEDNSSSASAAESIPALNEIAKLLAAALRQTAGTKSTPATASAPWRRKALVCASAAYREAIAETLAQHNYDVFLAENMAQGLGRMREERMDIVILDANFDPLEQGVAFISREVRLMRPSERRRLFFVYVTSGVRTMDLQAAFLHNGNLVVNPSDIEHLPEALKVSIRHYNELYKPFNKALDVAPI